LARWKTRLRVRRWREERDEILNQELNCIGRISEELGCGFPGALQPIRTE
jgi:hypothetical protein